MRQGQGIIDLVNVYLTIAMQMGLIGLFLFLGPFLLGMLATWRLIKRSSGADLEYSLLGASLLACMLATAFFMATGSFGGGLAKMYYVLAGFAAAYSQLGPLQKKPLPLQRNALRI
jgi:O-antigen ligase